MIIEIEGATASAKEVTEKIVKELTEKLNSTDYYVGDTITIEIHITQK